MAKAMCPVKCGRELGSESYVVCPTCFGEVPQRLKNDIARAALLVKNARKPMAVQAALRKQREARTAAVQFVVDKHNNQKVSA